MTCLSGKKGRNSVQSEAKDVCRTRLTLTARTALCTALLLAAYEIRFGRHDNPVALRIPIYLHTVVVVVYSTRRGNSRTSEGSFFFLSMSSFLVGGVYFNLIGNQGIEMIHHSSRRIWKRHVEFFVLRHGTRKFVGFKYQRKKNIKTEKFFG